MSGKDAKLYAYNVVLGQFGSRPPAGPPLQPPGGGGTYDDMDKRVTRLEAHIERAQKDIADVTSDMKRVLESVASISSKIDSLSSKADVATAIGKIDTIDAKLHDKVSTRTSYVIAAAMAALIVAASLGGVSRVATGLGLSSVSAPPAARPGS